MSISEKRRALIEGALEYATERQREIVSTYLEEGHTQAAETLGIRVRSIYGAVDAVIRKAQNKGFSPEHGVSVKPLPDYNHKRISTLRGGDGEVKMQWLIQEQDKASALMAVQGAIDRLVERIRPAATLDAPTAPVLNEDLLCQYTITDYHFGMLAWHAEGGDNWDVKIAKNTLINTFRYLISTAPPAKTGVFCNIGDFMHYDGWLPTTPTSGHILDTESRFPKVVDAAVDAILECIEMMLLKHEEVIVVNMQGNHDLASSYWLQKLCQVYFKQNPRVKFQQGEQVTVDRLVLPFYAIQHGDTSLFYHHGHKKALKLQGRLYPAQFPAIWGDTKFRYGHTGHYHHTEVMEDYGIKIEMHNSMCAKDAYASHGGYFAERSANQITYHKEHGEVGRNYVKPGMLS